MIYNFCQPITRSTVIESAKKKYTYKVNFSDAAHICLQFSLGRVRPPELESLLMRFTSPIRPGRKDTRKTRQKSAVNLIYRAA